MKTIDSLLADVAELEARVAALEASLRALVSDDPTHESSMGNVYCAHCGYDYEFTQRHKADCPWLQAKALLGE